MAKIIFWPIFMKFKFWPFWYFWPSILTTQIMLELWNLAQSFILWIPPGVFFRFLNFQFFGQFSWNYNFGHFDFWPSILTTQIMLELWNLAQRFILWIPPAVFFRFLNFQFFAELCPFFSFLQIYSLLTWQGDCKSIFSDRMFIFGTLFTI